MSLRSDFRNIVLACALWYPAQWAAALNHNDNSVNGLAKSYGFVLGQELSLKRIADSFPNLRSSVEGARLGFQVTFGDVKERLEQELTQAVGAPMFADVRSQLEKQLAAQLREQRLTPELAQQFIGIVNARAKGQEVDSGILRYLLAVRYAASPASEYANGFRQRFRTDGAGKSQGVRLSLQVPRSWLEQEGERPHIVRKWVSEGGTGTSVIMLLVREMGAETSDREIEHGVKSGATRREIAELGKIHKVETFTVERRKGVHVEFSNTEERVGSRIYIRAFQYQVHLKTKAIVIMCSTFAMEQNTAQVNAAATLLDPVCKQVVNSLVLDQVY